MTEAAHYFVFKPHMGATPRPCKSCGLPYAVGNHIEIPPMKPRTHFVCPADAGLGHSSKYTGDSGRNPELRTLRDGFCICGREFVEKDHERWLVSWEMRGDDEPWRLVDTIESKHAAHAHRDGLLALIAEGEQIRKVQIRALSALV